MGILPTRLDGIVHAFHANCQAMHLVASSACLVCHRNLAFEGYEHHNGRSTELTYSESGAFGQDPPGNPSETSTDSGAFLPDDVSNNDDDDVLQ